MQIRQDVDQVGLGGADGMHGARTGTKSAAGCHPGIVEGVLTDPDKSLLCGCVTRGCRPGVHRQDCHHPLLEEKADEAS
ncbi:hypothetical protein GTY86_26740 [Streptomyces sp. SID5770]|uniref:hypothetical protein n=1 Tax=Streptomyces sp. SID5770 TaxID=2690308 RepID=UPI0013722C42|nr:hypothetical protein [Streptomyces sp. SID5770]MZE51841.1 hypothetical protein [Streptomyces sp. SID5770]MZE54803.1 hypothetical protein [Streptomyces sp. SID5770]